MKKIKLSSIILFLFTFFLTFQGASAAEFYFPKGKGEVPAKAKEFAENHFKEIVVATIQNDNPSYYFLTDNTEDIKFGDLLPTYSMTRKFKKSTDDIKEPHKGLIQANEWISVVYQEGKPVNVIGTYKNEDNKYEFSTFGYGKSLAESLAGLKPSPDKKIFYEMPRNAWYLYQNGKVSGLNDSAKKILPAAVTVIQFRKDIIERYKDAKPILDANGNDSSVGGGDGGDTSQDLDEHKTLSPVVLYGSISLLAALAVTAFVIIRNKRSRSSEIK
ncbi:hypothetical protein [Bacillus sp. MUM 13]|uniref:hypothetical protein n=1 Tax=Bacillus sp. MUM 13 TaxID=1678001 RepID=UPI0008F55894|nr:hypothetical protein [Bacillus sp. MUM 13]OIK13754.1 hypothetical protein BIV59_04655 [Bacillus sp. MUM 13]